MLRAWRGEHGDWRPGFRDPGPPSRRAARRPRSDVDERHEPPGHPRTQGKVERFQQTIKRGGDPQVRGKVIKTTGDGILATFDGAARAVRCAVALRDEADDLGIRIRAAVHTGEIESTGSDIRGVAIHEASRVLGPAGTDEILVSAVTAGLAGDAGIEFEDRGDHELRGLGGTRRIYAVG